MKHITQWMFVIMVVMGGLLQAPAYGAEPAEKPGVSQGKAPVKPAKNPAAAVTMEDELRVSINAASAEELAQILNGVGLKKAESIVRYRDANGPFKTPEALTEVPGIGIALVERNRALIKL